MIEHVSEREQGVYTHAGEVRLGADDKRGGEHPRGNGDLDAIRKLDDETLRGLAP